MTCKQINTEVKSWFDRREGTAPQKLTEKQFQDIYTILAIDRGTERPRKDIAKYSEILTEFDYLFKPVKMTPLLERYKNIVCGSATKDDWFNTCKDRATEFGFKNVRDFTQAIRLELTGREKSTDLYTISKLLLGNL